MRPDPEARAAARRLARLALREDLGRAGDLTTRLFLPRGPLRAEIVCRQPGVLCGSHAAAEVFRLAAPGSRLRWRNEDGDRLRRGAAIAEVRGPREILTAERTALNFLQRLSGIATATAAFVARARGSRARILDTRKTAPGWRALDKYAVRCGGGLNHRRGLYDMVLLKDNHLAAWRSARASAEALRARLRALRRRRPRVPVEVEAKTRAEVEQALALGADLILLDDMAPARLRREIRFIRRRAPRVGIEVSGGVDLDSVARLSRLGPDRISVGRITHSAPALDMSLELLE